MTHLSSYSLEKVTLFFNRWGERRSEWHAVLLHRRRELLHRSIIHLLRANNRPVLSGEIRSVNASMLWINMACYVQYYVRSLRSLSHSALLMFDGALERG